MKNDKIPETELNLSGLSMAAESVNKSNLVGTVYI